jgi:hypothetical protein
MTPRLDGAELLARYPVLVYFSWDHLPPHLQDVSSAFGTVAWEMATELTPSAEVSAGLRKLLEAKDCMVRAALSDPPMARGCDDGPSSA